MSQKNDTPALILALLITVALLAGGYWLLGIGSLPFFKSGSGSNPTATSSDASPIATGDLQSRFSTGSRSLIPGASADKQAGITSIAQGNFDSAVTSLQASLQANRNDPEALIYLNNARIGNQKSYSIAASVPIGSDLNAAQEMLRGVVQAQDEVNRAGGISGIPVKVVIANDDDNPDIAKQVAQGLVDNADVLGVVGHYASDVSIAAAPVYKAGGLVAISPVSTSVKLSGISPYTFRTVPSDYVAARALADYVLNTLKQKNAAVFYNSKSGYSQSLKSEFVTALGLGGGRVTNEFDLSDSGFSPARSLEQATQQGATVLAMLPNSGTLDRALQVVEVNQGKLKLLGGDDVYSPKTLEVGSSQAVGMVVAVPWNILSDPQSPFVQQSRQLWGGDVNWRTAMSYDAAKALIAALTQNQTREGIQKALSTPNFSAAGATGTVSFLPSGDRNQSDQLVKIQPGSRSGLGYDFVPAR